jgi:hypothetical protein
MKFLRLAFYVLIAQLVLSGCAGEAVEETSSSSSSEINFDAYLGRNASTRSEVTDNTHLKGTEGNSGFGVFARYNYNGKILSLLDTEHVTWNKDQNHWEYTNTRFWPSEGSVDFYAFAPYSTAPKLESPNKNEANPTCIYFPSNLSPIDLVWANAMERTKTNDPVKFTFNHALARLGLDIKANQKLEKNGAVITVNKVILYGASETSGVFVMAGYLNLENGAWTLADNGISWFYTWTPDGKVDGNEEVKKNGTVLKLSASQLDHTNDIITNADDSYLFIIPQDLPKNFNLKITYTVKQGDFEEEVTVTKNLLDVLSGDSKPYFKGGKAYVFHLKLSLDPINFKVTPEVEPWK